MNALIISKENLTLSIKPMSKIDESFNNLWFFFTISWKNVLLQRMSLKIDLFKQWLFYALLLINFEQN